MRKSYNIRTRMPAAHAKVAVKRVYEEPSDTDGTRVLVDRLWPRWLTKAEARVHVWLRDLAPSNELRKWTHAHPERWAEFRQRYSQELRSEPAAEALQQAHQLLTGKDRVTLVFASKNCEQNNAIVLRDFLERLKKQSVTK